VSWRWPWRQHVECEQDDAILRAEQLRDMAQDQNRKVTEQAERVDAAADSLRQLRSENHFGPMIENILRGAK